jgi:hypothetical protein
MSKYRKLTEYLKALDSTRWTASFAEIEAILGFKLPKSAYSYPAWWANQAGEGHSHCAAWKNIGWRTEGLDISKRRVSFSYLKEEDGDEADAVSAVHPVGRLTIAQAKAGLAASFGVRPDDIEITIKY